MQFGYLFCVVFLITFLNSESRIAENDYVLMPPLFHMDDFDKCLMLGENALFCSITVQLAPIKTNYSKVWTIIQEAISDRNNFRHDRLRHSICVPLYCPQMGENISSFIHEGEYLRHKISECYTGKYKNIGLLGEVVEMRCENDKSLYEIDVCDIIVGLCLVGLMALLIFATFYEGLARYKSKEEYHRIINTKRGKIFACFSISKNWDRLRTKNNSPDGEPLKSLHGMRFFTMLLVIITHACMIAFCTYSTNPQFEETMTSDPLNILFVNGNYVMQTFLLMSGMLLSYYFFLAIEKQKQIRFSYLVLAFINRYIRLTPCLIIMIAINATWLRHLNRGPMWDKTVGDEFRNCRKNWWMNLLYINNYFEIEHMCLIQTWYLAADTQLFVFSLVILMVIWKYKKYTWVILWTCFAVGCIIPMVVTFVNGYDILIREYPESMYKILLDVPEWTKLLIPGHMNIGSYSLGLITGHILYKYRGKKIALKKRFVVLWWILVWGLPLSIIFMGIPMYHDNFVYSPIGAAVYQGLGRIVFVVGITLGIVGFTQNIGWFLRDIVLWSPLQLFGRLTYCVFLVHIALIRVRSGQARVMTYLSPYTFVTSAASDILLAYGCAVILCLTVEMPTSALLKLMMPQFKKERDTVLITDDSKYSINDKESESTQV